jgi:iron complex outermembrane receptor protein
LSANGYDIFNRKGGRILSARPNTKVLLGMNYDLKKQLSFLTTLTLKLLGNMPRISKDQTLGKVITDLGIAYKFTSTLSANDGKNNLMYIQIYWIQKGCCD